MRMLVLIIVGFFAIYSVKGESPPQLTTETPVTMDSPPSTTSEIPQVDQETKKSTADNSQGCDMKILYLPVIQAGALQSHTQFTQTAPQNCDCSHTARKIDPEYSTPPSFHQYSARQGRTGKREIPRWASLPLDRVGTKRYLFITTNKLSWMESIQFCTMMGMEPISLLNAQETQLLTAHINTMNTTDGTLWINGATSIGTSGNYRWFTSGQPVVEQDIVMSLDSVESPLKRCIVWKYGQLEAEYCNTRPGYNFICEIIR